MKAKIVWLICAVNVVSLAFLVAAPAATGQADAEYRPHAADRAAWPRDAVRGAKAMVTTDKELGSKAGAEILKRGGNAVDAAVAVGFALR